MRQLILQIILLTMFISLRLVSPVINIAISTICLFYSSIFIHSMIVYSKYDSMIVYSKYDRMIVYSKYGSMIVYSKYDSMIVYSKYGSMILYSKYDSMIV